MLKKSKKTSTGLDLTDIKILEAIGIHGPRSITRVAKKLDMHPETVRFRIKRMRSSFPLFFVANVYHTFVGLRKVVVLAEATPGYEDLLLDCLKTNEYWLYTSPSYGSPEIRLMVYGIPKEHMSEFEKFLQQVKSLGIAQDIQVFWTTCFQTVNLTRNWFDGDNGNWVFPWDEWIEEIQNERTKLPFPLVEPEDYPQKADYIDIIILKEFEKNAAVKFTDLAKILHESLQTIEYHYKEHVIKERLLESWQTYMLYFDVATSDLIFFKFDFDNHEKLSKFALSLLDKPFVTTVGKVFSENSLLVQVYLPRAELGELTRRLSKLVREGFLRFYYYIILDGRRTKRETIPYQSFKGPSWIYDHNKHLKKLQELVEQTKIKHN